MVDYTKLPGFVAYFNETFDQLTAIATQMDAGETFKSSMVDKVNAAKDQTSKQLADILLGKVTEDVITKFKTDLGITA